jgi:hypothetical protein
MGDESNFETSNGHPYFNEWESGFTGELEDEWQQVAANYSNQEVLPEWEGRSVEASHLNIIPLPVHREEQIPKIRQIIAHCRRIAFPVARQILKETAGEMPVFSSKDRIRHLLLEFDDYLSLAESEVSSLETEALGENEFSSELAASESAQELALTEVLAAEASHFLNESEAQSLLATALPINMALLGTGSRLRNMLPALTQSNAKLVRSLLQSGKSSRQTLGLVPAIQRRVLSGLKAAQNNPAQLTSDLINRHFAAQTAKVLVSPSIIGKTLVRNQAIRNATMLPCPRTTS